MCCFYVVMFLVFVRVFFRLSIFLNLIMLLIFVFIVMLVMCLRIIFIIIGIENLVISRWVCVKVGLMFLGLNMWIVLQFRFFIIFMWLMLQLFSLGVLMLLKVSWMQQFMLKLCCVWWISFRYELFIIMWMYGILNCVVIVIFLIMNWKLQLFEMVIMLLLGEVIFMLMVVGIVQFSGFVWLQLIQWCGWLIDRNCVVVICDRLMVFM